MLGPEVSVSALEREQLGSVLRPTSQTARWKFILKRILDILGSSALLLLFSPWIALFSLVIKAPAS